MYVFFFCPLLKMGLLGRLSGDRRCYRFLSVVETHPPTIFESFLHCPRSGTILSNSRATECEGIVLLVACPSSREGTLAGGVCGSMHVRVWTLRRQPSGAFSKPSYHTNSLVGASMAYQDKRSRMRMREEIVFTDMIVEVFSRIILRLLNMTYALSDY